MGVGRQAQALGEWEVGRCGRSDAERGKLRDAGWLELVRCHVEN